MGTGETLHELWKLAGLELSEIPLQLLLEQMFEETEQVWLQVRESVMMEILMTVMDEALLAP